MGFFHVEQKRVDNSLKGISTELLWKMECKACPLNQELNLRHPHMDPYGTDKPVIYILGEAPGETEDRRGRPFVGEAGQVLRLRIPEGWDDNNLRWNNCVRTRPPKNRDPSPVELECCRPSVQGDIERTKPVAIFGFGAIPLKWAIKQSRITVWAGRRVPVRIGSHTCWFYPMLHPSYILRTRKFTPRSPSDFGSDLELSFAMDLKRAFAEVEAGLPEPVVDSEEDALSNLDFISGGRGQKDVDYVLEMLDYMASKQVVGLDYETKGGGPKGLRPYTPGSKILTVGLASEDVAFGFPLRHRGAEWSESQLATVEEAFKNFLLTAKCRKVAHRLSFEQEWSGVIFGRETIRAGTWGDTLTQAFVLDERGEIKMRAGPFSLEFLTQQYFGINIKALAGVNRMELDNTPLDIVLRYQCLDAKYHRKLYFAQATRIKEAGLQDFYNHMLRRVPTLVLTQMKGIPVDQKVVQSFHRRYQKRLELIEANITELPSVHKLRQRLGHDFRPSANKDVEAFLASIGLGGEGTDENLLKTVNHPLARLVLKWRGVNKLDSTYIRPLMEGAETLYEDGRLHPILNSTSTRTSRTSAEDVNEQNWPKRKHREVRSTVRSLNADELIVSIDYAQIQARNVAMESKDAALIKAFWDRYDIHTDWMEKVAKVYPKWVEEGVKALVHDPKVRKLYRDKAKNEFVFPSFFGARDVSVAGYLGVPEDLITPLHEEFWDMFPDIKGWHKRLTKSYRKTGYVHSLAGFRGNAPISQNQIVNTPIQADEAIIVCDAMARLSELDDPKFQPIMEIHDDLTFIWRKQEIEKNLEIVVPMMINVPFKWAHIVPIGIEVSVGEDWEKTKGIGEYFSDLWSGDLSLKHDDPFIGSWSDGTGWANSNKYEKTAGRKAKR